MASVANDVDMLNVIKLSVVNLSVVAPFLSFLVLSQKMLSSLPQTSCLGGVHASVIMLRFAQIFEMRFNKNFSLP
jgi:hypothetical protein